MVSKPRLPGRVRSGRSEDLPTVHAITVAVFSVYGEYGSWLPGYLGHPGVWTLVYEEEGKVVGFAMLGVLDVEGQAPGPGRGGGRVGDLLAIAVQPGAQDRGIGRALLGMVLDKATRLREVLDLEEIRLTVADDNDRARHLFGSFGFEAIEGDHGHYERGQRALRLRLRL